MTAGTYTVEKPLGNKGDWAIVSRGSLAECYAWIKFANNRRRHQQTYRVVDAAGKVVQGRPEAKEVSVGS